MTVTGIAGFSAEVDIWSLCIEETTSLDSDQFPLYGEAKFIDCVRRVRVELHQKHGFAVLVALSWTRCLGTLERIKR